MNNSFNENFQWVMLLGVGGVYGYYLSQVLPPAGVSISAENVALFVILLVALILIHIVGAIVCAALNRFKDPESDERDRLIVLKSYRPAYYVLTVGVFQAMACAFFLPGNFWVLHSLLAGLVLAQIVESAMQIIHYRRGF